PPRTRPARPRRPRQAPQLTLGRSSRHTRSGGSAKLKLAQRRADELPDHPLPEVAVSLHGTLETFALPDVLTLLTATKKSGELRVVGGRIDGRVWFDAGEVVGADVAGGTSAVDAIFELLRLPSGTFSFDADRTAPSPGAPAATDILLADAQARLSEWREIETVIPSLDHLVRLVPEGRDPSGGV